MKATKPVSNKIPVRSLTKTLAGQFNMIDVAQLLAGRDMQQGLHRHNFFWMLVVSTGGGSQTVDFTPYPITPCTVFIVRPGQVHQLALTAQSTGYIIQFSKPFLQKKAGGFSSLFATVTANTCYSLTAPQFADCYNTINLIYKEASLKQAGFNTVIKALLKVFFVQLARHISTVAPVQGGSHAQQTLLALQKLMEANISTTKQVKQYAQMLNLTAYQLNAVTKKLLGKTCQQLINDEVIAEARRLLLATASPVAQIASQLGYNDASYFIRFFKVHTGQSPQAYRKNFMQVP